MSVVVNMQSIAAKTAKIMTKVLINIAAPMMRNRIKTKNN